VFECWDDQPGRQDLTLLDNQLGKQHGSSPDSVPGRPGQCCIAGRGAPKWSNENSLFRAPYPVLMCGQVRGCEMADQLIFCNHCPI